METILLEKKTKTKPSVKLALKLAKTFADRAAYYDNNDAFVKENYKDLN